MVRMGPGDLQACRYALLAAGLALLQACGSPTEPTPPPPPPPPPPVLAITCPAAGSGVSHFNQPVAISWSAPTTTGGTTPVATTCTPSSGSPFAAGTTTVTCRATDAGTQNAACSFQVIIARPPELTATRFLAFGDSMTEGGQQLPPSMFIVVPTEAYPFRLNALLGARYEDQSIVMTNAGWSGRAVADDLNRLPDVLAQYHPEVLLLLHGANDLLNLPSSATTQYIAGVLRDMVKVTKSLFPSTRVMLANFPPQREGTYPYNRGAGAPFVPELNLRIAAVATAERVILVDLYGGFPADTTGLIGVDGLHPTAAGFYLMAQIFAQAIKASFEKPSAVAPLPLR